MTNKKKLVCCLVVVAVVLLAMIAAGVAGYFIYKNYKKSGSQSKITVKLSDALEKFSNDK